ncbi:MAG TPA: I78 family peptidase inhibitor [Novosphingobium sp.]
MPVFHKSIGLAAVLALTACTQPESQVPAPAVTPAPIASAQPAPPSESAKPEPAADECGASKLGSYMGQAAGADTMAKIKQTIGHERIRTINPGDAVTMDFRPDRLNVEVGEDGRIKRLHCG